MYRGDRHQHSGQGEEREVMGQKERKAVAAFAQGKPCMLKDRSQFCKMSPTRNPLLISKHCLNEPH